MTFIDWIREPFTDALGRPEIKNIIGIPVLIAGFVFAFLGMLKVVPFDLGIWSTVMAFAVGLLVTTAVADAKIDASA
jgi:hypothetical protein